MGKNVIKLLKLSLTAPLKLSSVSIPRMLDEIADDTSTGWYSSTYGVPSSRRNLMFK